MGKEMEREKNMMYMENYYMKENIQMKKGMGKEKHLMMMEN